MTPEIDTQRAVFLSKVYTNAISARMSKKLGQVPTNADGSSRLSVRIAQSIAEQLGFRLQLSDQKEQTSGKNFEHDVCDFLANAMEHLHHLMPGKWQFGVNLGIEAFAQFKHLANIRTLIKKNPELMTAFGDYLVKPDVIVSRLPYSESEINSLGNVVGVDGLPFLSPARAVNTSNPILHASVSCKLTFRADRSQNSRTEGLNIIRNRIGHTPHIAVVTAEPMPTRLASLALGTGDIDCVYHITLPELRRAVDVGKDSGSKDILGIMIEGSRLRDISDLPFDLLV